ncbi:YdcF family protein [Thioclava sp.]|uniref:YdcF family protein n=1 Tax=Thioclava sp. TaxID=1933450 RepID=UPI003AA95E88
MTDAFILGAAVWPDEQPSPALKRRVLHGAALFHAGDVSRLVCCGGVGKHGPSEAEVMARILRARGVSEAALVLEDRSTSTRENILFGLDVSGAKGPIVLITDGSHAPRARATARALGVVARASCPKHKPRPRTWLREGGAWLKFLWWRGFSR